jgi:hypothetical protein
MIPEREETSMQVSQEKKAYVEPTLETQQDLAAVVEGGVPTLTTAA